MLANTKVKFSLLQPLTKDNHGQITLQLEEHANRDIWLPAI